MAERTLKLVVDGDTQGLQQASKSGNKALKKWGSQFEKWNERATTSSKGVGRAVRGASDRTREAGSGFDRARDSFDALDSKAMGFRDTMTGVQDSMEGVSQISRGNLFEGLFTLGMGVGDLASGFANFLIPAIKSATKAMIANIAQTVRSTVTNARHRTSVIASTVATKAQTVATKTFTAAQRALNLVMRANPFILVATLVIALGAALVTAYKKSETFRNIVQAAFAGVRNAAGWVIDKVQDVLSWFRRIGSGVRDALSGVAGAITSPFRNAFNGIRRAWNSTVGGKGFDIPDWVPGIGGNSFRIPRLHSGGIYRAPRGRTEGLALLRDGERVVTPGQHSSDEVTVNVLLSEKQIAGIAEVEVRKGNKAIRREILDGAGVTV